MTDNQVGSYSVDYEVGYDSTTFVVLESFTVTIEVVKDCSSLNPVRESPYALSYTIYADKEVSQSIILP